MAGGHHHTTIKLDPAFERWNNMRENYYKNFKFTPAVTRSVIIMGIIVPVAIWSIADSQNLKWDWAGKTKTEPLLRNPPPPPAAADEE